MLEDAKHEVVNKNEKPAKKKFTTNLLILYIGAFLIISYNFVPVLYNEYTTSNAIYLLKVEFNRKLELKNCSEEYFKCMKILINNYRIIKDKSIFNVKDVTVLKEFIKNMKCEDVVEFYLFSPTLLFATLTPTLGPLAMSIITLIKGY